MIKQITHIVFMNSILIVIFLLPSQCLAEYMATPLFFLSKGEFADIEDDLGVRPSQEEQIKAVIKNKFQTQQTLIKKGNRLIGIIDAYESIQNKRDYWDKEAMEIASGLSKNQIAQMRKDWEKIQTLKSQAHMIDDLKIKEVLDDEQITQWYKYKFYHHAEGILSKKGISVNEDILAQKVSRAVSEMLSVYNVINQEIVDEVFLNMTLELRQDKTNP